MPTKQLFLSAVSAEFSGCREELEVRLGDHFHVRTQRHFSQGGGSLLAKLDEYIRSCDAVVHLVGDSRGHSPTTAEVAEHIEQNPELAAFMASTGVPNPSYTQWEAYLALYHDKSLFVFLPDPAAARQADSACEAPAGDAGQQTAHLEALFAKGKDRSVFVDRQDLALKAMSALVRAGLLDSSELRQPNSLPLASISNSFKGREASIRELDRLIGNDAPGGRSHAIAILGLAGVGKTRLAIEFAWRRLQRFTGVFFVSADTPEDLDANLAAMAAPNVLALPEYSNRSESEARDAVIRWLQCNRDWLLILDNVDTPEGQLAVQRLVPRLPAGQLLVTSRLAQWARSVEPLALAVIAEDDAVKLLLESTGVAEADLPAAKSTARRIAERLGCLPLALTHATAYISYFGIDLDTYLDHFENTFADLIAYDDDTLLEYDASSVPRQGIKTIASTFFLSFDSLGVVEKTIFQAASFLGAEAIPFSVFESSPEHLDRLVRRWSAETGESSENPLAVAQAIAELARFSLVERSTGFFSIHRLVHRLLRSRPKSDDIRGWTGDVYALLRASIPVVSGENPESWEQWERLRPHVEEIIEQSTGVDGIEAPLELMAGIAQFYFGKGLYSLSLSMDLTRVAEAERIAGKPNAVPVANALLALGESYRMLKKERDAERVFRKTLAIREELDGPRSERVADALNYLGLTLTDTTERISCFRRAISIYEELGDKAGASDVAKALHNLALDIQKENPEEALDLMRRAYELTHDNDVKPQLAIICSLHYSDLLINDDALRSEELLLEARQLSRRFPVGHEFRCAVGARHARFLRNASRLVEARAAYEEIATLDDQARVNSGVHTKLRTLECGFELDAEGRCIDTVAPEAGTTHSRPPARRDSGAVVNGVVVNDVDTLSLSFSIGGLDDSSAEDTASATRELIDYFRVSLSVAETSQWARSGGELPAGIQGTGLGDVLLHHAGLLQRCAMDAWRHSGELQAAVRAATADNGAGFEVELWASPDVRQVYTGSLEGIGSPASPDQPEGPDAVDESDAAGLLDERSAHRERQEESAEAELHAYVTECSLAVHAEVRPKEAAGSATAARILEGMKRHLVPGLQQTLAVSGDFALLRQADRCMLLAVWMKERFGRHPIAGRFETGDVLDMHIKRTSQENYEDALRRDVSAAETRDPQSLETALALNNLSVFLRSGERAAEALKLARRALEIEQRHRGESHPKITHRLVNLALCLLVCTDYAEAASVLARASASAAARRDATAARVLVLEVLLATLTRANRDDPLRALRSLLAAGEPLAVPLDISANWGIDSAFARLKEHLAPLDEDFIGQLARAIGDPLAVDRLDAFEAWRKAR